MHHDIPPFCKIDIEGRPVGINTIRLSREGVAAEDIKALEESSRLLFGRRKPQAVAITELEGKYNGTMPLHLKQIIDFLKRRNAGKHGRYLESLR